MSPEKVPMFITVRRGMFWDIVPWKNATQEQRSQWIMGSQVESSGDKSAAGERPGHGKNQRKCKRGGQKDH